MPVAGCDKVVAIFREGDGFDFGGDLVGGDFNVVVPIPDVDNHVLLRTHGHHIFA